MTLTTSITRVVAYIRASTFSQKLGPEAQRTAITGWAMMRGLDAEGFEWVEENGVSGSLAPEERALLGPVLDSLDVKGGLLVVSHLSRLGRSVRDVLRVVDRADTEGWSVAVLDASVDTSTPSGRFTLAVLSAAAELELAQLRERTRAALAERKAQGVRLGRPVSEATRMVAERAFELRSRGLTLQAVADRVNADGFHTARGHEWTASGISRALKTRALDREAQDAAAAVGC